MKVRIPSKVYQFQESVIREMTRIAEKENALNLSQGLPDFSAPVELKRAASLAIENDFNQYSFTYGDARLREKIAEKLGEKNDIDVDPETEVTITCGVSEGVMAACLALLDRDDEVIVFEPYYENYIPGIILAGAKPVFATLHRPDYHIDFDELETKFNRKTKALILNTPMNPSGKIFTEEDMKRIGELCEKWNVVVITDEIYEDIIYDEQAHISFASLPGMFQRTVSVMGFSKSYSVTGWRVGYVAAEEVLSDAIRRVHDYLTICAPTPFQMGALAALELPNSYYTTIKATYQKKREIFCGGLQELGFKLEFPSGAYYVLADFSELSEKDDLQFSRFLTENMGVASVPGSSFYRNKELGKPLIRFSFALKEETLKDALNRIEKKISEL